MEAEERIFKPASPADVVSLTSRNGMAAHAMGNNGEGSNDQRADGEMCIRDRCK